MRQLGEQQHDFVRPKSLNSFILQPATLSVLSVMYYNELLMYFIILTIFAFSALGKFMSRISKLDRPYISSKNLNPVPVDYMKLVSSELVDYKFVIKCRNIYFVPNPIFSQLFTKSSWLCNITFKTRILRIIQQMSIL